MGEETISVGEVSRGDEMGSNVELPIVDLLTGRGFITGKSGSGKSNSASVIAEKLLDRGYSLLAVDIDGEYYGLKEEYEILHVGGDEECDLQVNEEHAGKIAELALEQNVPIILDISSFLDESKARDLLTEVTKHLFAKEKKLKQPFLMLIEEVHEFIPEGGGMDECGRMLIKVGKRGRKHGLGIVGISQRPADVKKDFITQCDWLCWHRLTWNNDTKVVGRILGSEYANHIEEMDDGECFLMTDWAEEIRVVQFERKQTFDAGATPGLDDFERPELKSVSGDLVEELQDITEEQEHRENRIEELQRELQSKEERIRDLEKQLSDARDLKQMADRFSRAMMEQVTGRPLSTAPGRQSELEEAARGPVRRDPELEAELDAIRNGEKEPQSSPVPDASESADTSEENEPESAATSDASSEPAEPEPVEAKTTEATASADTKQDGATDAFAALDTDALSTDDSPTGSNTEPSVAEIVGGTTGTERSSETAAADADDSLAARLQAEIDALDDIAVGMLRQYRNHGPVTPQDAHAAAGGSGDRTGAYAANRTLREHGFVTHVARGNHDYALPSLVVSESKDPFNLNNTLPAAERDRIVQAVESSFVPGVDAPGAADPGTTTEAETDAESDESATAADGGATASQVEPWPDA
ncbi:MAG: hypothetical protein ACI80F_001842 [Natronomonas sp.]|jgi:hypothetical protein|uniref:helicase HerA domain-containing protein n=2 Tax=Natronomonas sp. TaxID=2184060 RepID=UPI003989A134